MLDAMRAEELNHEPVEAPDFARRSFRLIEMERYEEAAEMAERGIRLAPADGKLRYNAAMAHMRLGRNEAALQHVRVIPYDAADIGEQALFLRAVLLRGAGAPAEAIPILEMLLSRNPGYADAIILQAQCMEAAGQKEAAAQLMEHALNDAPPQNRHRFAIELGSLYLRMERFADAQRVAESALATS